MADRARSWLVIVSLLQLCPYSWVAVLREVLDLQGRKGQAVPEMGDVPHGGAPRLIEGDQRAVETNERRLGLEALGTTMFVERL